MNQFFRSLSIQGSWNFPRMQGLGFFFCLLPWLEKVSDRGCRDACQRNLGYFNTNPCMSPYILGVVSRLEEEGRGEEGIRARNNLMGPLGAMGDGYYWATLVPVTVLISILLSFFFKTAAPVVFLLLYNVLHLKNRWKYLNQGYINAGSPLEGVSDLNGRYLPKILDHMVSPLLGVILGLAAFSTYTPGTALLIFVAAFLMFRRMFKTPAIFAFLVILGVILGFLGPDMRIPWSV